MFRHLKSVVIGAATAGLVCAVVAGSSAALGSTSRAAKSTAVAIPNLQTRAELHYVPLTPCVLVDTRKAGGAFGTGTTRSYGARGTTSLAPQGGSSTGCGVPTGASTIAATVRAIAPVHVGHITAKAFGSAVSAPIVAEYLANQTIGFQVNLKLAAAGAGNAFTLTNSGGPTQVTVRVDGYFIAPITGAFDENGSAFFAQRVVSTQNLGTGHYKVVTDRDVKYCTFIPTAVAAYSISAQTVVANANAVEVKTFDSAGDPVDDAFNLTVIC